MTQIKAPWTDYQVQNLNAFQRIGMFHPFTCGYCPSDLTATAEGWICEECSYTQDWAHDFMCQDHVVLEKFLHGKGFECG